MKEIIVCLSNIQIINPKKTKKKKQKGRKKQIEFYFKKFN